jgi:hypothetical protein
LKNFIKKYEVYIGVDFNVRIKNVNLKYLGDQKSKKYRGCSKGKFLSLRHGIVFFFFLD